MPRLYIGLIPVVLTACGGSNGTSAGSPTVLPAFSETGYANEDDQIAFGDVFHVPGATRVVGTSGDLSIEQQDVRIAIAEDGESFELAIDNHVFVVPSINGELYRIDDGDLLVRIFDNGSSRYHGIYSELELTVIQGENINVSHVPIGYNASADDVERLSSTASYNGVLRLQAFDGENYGEIGGSGELLVDFSSGAISGDFDLSISPFNRSSDLIVEVVGFDGSFIEIPEGIYSLSETTISDNTFAGTITYVENDDISQLDLNGTFFGSQAEVVSGTASGTITDTNFGTTALVTGQLIGSVE